MSGARALAGVRVLDAATNTAGPYAASVLADFGADVVKIEPPNGDPMRAYPPFRDGTTTQFAAINHAKRYLTLDLRSDAGRGVGRATRRASRCTRCRWRRTAGCSRTGRRSGC